MQILLIIAVAVHVVAGVFWAGSTFTLARADGVGAERLVRPQMGAATVTVLAGLVLWGIAHRGGFHRVEEVLGLGALCAIAAAGVQGMVVLPATRRLQGASPADATGMRGRIAGGERAAAGLLMITVICMAISRYV